MKKRMDTTYVIEYMYNKWNASRVNSMKPSSIPIPEGYSNQNRAAAIASCVRKKYLHRLRDGSYAITRLGKCAARALIDRKMEERSLSDAPNSVEAKADDRKLELSCEIDQENRQLVISIDLNRLIS